MAKCGVCGKSFHACGSCGLSNQWEYEYCCEEHYLQSDYHKDMVEKSNAIAQALTPPIKDFLLEILGCSDAEGILERVLKNEG